MFVSFQKRKQLASAAPVLQEMDFVQVLPICKAAAALPSTLSNMCLWHVLLTNQSRCFEVRSTSSGFLPCCAARAVVGTPGTASLTVANNWSLRGKLVSKSLSKLRYAALFPHSPDMAWKVKRLDSFSYNCIAVLAFGSHECAIVKVICGGWGMWVEVGYRQGYR